MSTGRQHKDYLRRAYQMGGHTTVPSGETVAVLVELHERMSYSAIGRALGTTHNYVTKIIRGEIKRMSPERHAQIMRLGNHQPTDSSHVKSLGSVRRLRALHTLGYSWERLERELDGYSLGGIKAAVYGRRPVIEARTVVAIEAAYERLSMKLPVAANKWEASGITRARNNAKARGWAPPLAWDDIDRDAHPVGGFSDAADEVLIDRILSGDYSLARTATKAERIEIVARWRADGRPLNELERGTGWQSRRYVTTTSESGAA